MERPPVVGDVSRIQLPAVDVRSVLSPYSWIRGRFVGAEALDSTDSTRELDRRR